MASPACSGGGDGKPGVEGGVDAGVEDIELFPGETGLGRFHSFAAARRRAAQGHAFSPDAPWQRELEEAFPYELTPDQERAIDEVKRDMESGQPMDRLLVGDVGYGKTEVAVRAAFKAVMDGFQVAVLAPTTVLAAQHFSTFRKRITPKTPIRPKAASMAQWSRMRNTMEVMMTVIPTCAVYVPKCTGIRSRGGSSM